jgi:hypothetical protein
MKLLPDELQFARRNAEIRCYQGSNPYRMNPSSIPIRIRYF